MTGHWIVPERFMYAESVGSATTGLSSVERPTCWPRAALGSELPRRRDRDVPDEVRVEGPGAGEDDMERGLRLPVRQLDRGQGPRAELAG